MKKIRLSEMMERRKEKGFGVLLTTPDGKLICHICGESFNDLSKHAYQRHKIRADEYRTRFGLNKSQALISKESATKRKENVLRHPELIEKLKENTKNTRFQKHNQFAKEKRRQWELSQENKQKTKGKRPMYIEKGWELGKSGLGAKARWRSHSPAHGEIKEKKIERINRLIFFELQVQKAFELCTTGDRSITDDELYEKYPRDVVDEALKRELDWLADKKTEAYFKQRRRKGVYLVKKKSEDS